MTQNQTSRRWPSGATYDVVIVGYGPVGAVLANLLGKYGLAVLVVDQSLDIYDKPRAINIDHEVMRTLQSAGLGGAVGRITSHHTGTEFRGLDNRLIKVFRPLAPPYPLGWPPNLMFVQPEFEPILRDGVRRFPTVDVRLGCQAMHIEQDDDEARVDVLESASGAVVTARARYVVACDGAVSPTRRQLGISQESLDFDEWWTVVDAWVTRPTPLPAWTTQFCLPEGPTTYVVGPRNLRRWELKLLPHERPEDYADPAAVRRRLAPFVDTTAIDLWRIATYRFHALVADTWRQGRVFLAGDAAHQMPPFLAQGLCSGIRDAANLAWKLAGVLRAGYADALLDTYQEERRPHIKQLVVTTKALGEIIGELDPERALARDARMNAELESGRAETVRQKLIPDLVAGIIDREPGRGSAPPAGSLFPQPQVRDRTGRSALLDDWVGERFLLLTRDEAPQQWLDAPADATLARLNFVRVALVPDPAQATEEIGIVKLAETGTLLADWLVHWTGMAVVVRPDKYTYGVAAGAQRLRAMIDVLGKQVGVTVTS